MNKLSITTDFINMSSENVFIKYKGGLEIDVPKINSIVGVEERYLLVKIKGGDFSYIKVNTMRGLTKLDRRLLELIEDRKESSLKEKDVGLWGVRDVDISIKVDLHSELDEGHGSYHSEILGGTFYVGDIYKNSPALNTPGMTISELKDSVKKWGGLTTGIFINDLDGEFDTLFTNMYGKTYRIPVVKDTEREQGVYIIKPSEVGNSTGEFYSFNSLDNKKLLELGLYKSRSEAGKGEVAESINRLNKEINYYKDECNKKESIIEKQKQEISKHQLEISGLKTQHRLEVSSMKATLDLIKQENKIKEIATKNQLETTKSRLDDNNIGALVKAIGIVGGIGLGAYKAYQNWSE